MGASRHVGRVGGLAVALGVGAAVYSGCALASADTGSDGASNPAGASDSARLARAGVHKGPGASRSTSANNSRPAAAAVRAPKVSAAVPAAATTRRAALAGVAPAPAKDTATASVTTTAVTNNGVTVDPGVTLFDGVIQGNLNATSAKGNPLVFKFVTSSAGGKLDLGNVPTGLDALLPANAKGGAQSFTALPYATWIEPKNPTTVPTPTGTQTFDVRVSENTKFDQFIVKIPLAGMLAEPIIALLQQTPFVSNLLAPIIGGAVTAQVSVDVGALTANPQAAPKPLAYTYKVTSFDGTQISMNFFPATQTSLFPGNFGATLFNGPGLGSPGTTNPYGSYQTSGSTPGLATLRGQGLSAGSGFNVMTWDPRGEGASGGQLELDNPMYEGRDVSSLIDWSLANTGTLSVAGSPLIGMVGGSYGGTIQLATVDPRIKAIVPGIAWNSLNESLYPNNVFKTAWANTLALSLLEANANVNNQIPLGILTGNLFGFIGKSGQAALGSSGPGPLLTKLNAPTLYVQGIVDALFPLNQALTNAQIQLDQNPYFADKQNQVKMIWYCGGHGVCLDPVDQKAQATTIFTDHMYWLNRYVKGADIPVDYLVPTFQWWDQAGAHYTSALFPFSDGFGSGTVTGTSFGGQVGILPFAIGGSGPNKTSCSYAPACQFPLNQTFATQAKNALDVSVTVPTANTEIVGAPMVSFTYSGWGNSKALYAQVVDEATGRVLGNIATPIPVTLDGKSHTTSVSIADIAYTAPTPNSKLTVQIVGSASLYKNGTFGSVKLSNVTVGLPTTTAGIKV